jgi:SpoVK/Ycf46/Vps4 family AAA+-type ATPase
MVGLDNIKRDITTMANRTKFYMERRRMGLPTSDKAVFHAIFTGNPGTGKTTVARMLGKIYHSLGLLSRGNVIAVDRTRIVGRYIGETEENMKAILHEAQGNVLFVDEAYTLYNKNDEKDFGRHALEALLDVLARHNPDMLIIFAGYQDEMDRLMSMNPGLVGRFPYKFLFKDYTTDELMQIAQSLLAADDYQLSDDAARQLAEAIRATQAQHSKHFGNARWVHQFVHNGIIPALANRLATTTHPFTREVYQRIEADDVQRAYELFNPKTIELKPHRQVGFSA